MTPIKAGAWRLPVAALVLLGPACSPATSAEPGPGHSVLFVGNSLTYTNHLRAMVERVAKAAGDSVRVRMVAGMRLPPC